MPTTVAGANALRKRGAKHDKCNSVQASWAAFYKLTDRLNDAIDALKDDDAETFLLAFEHVDHASLSRSVSL